MQVTVKDTPTKNVKGSLSCDLGQELGKTIKCHGEVNRGSDSEIPVDFGDGFNENLILSKKKNDIDHWVFPEKHCIPQL